MNRDVMWEAMEHLAPDLIEEADRPAAQKRRSRGKMLLIAAAVCLVLAAGVVAADSLLGFKVREFFNGGAQNRYTLQPVEITQFPVAQFGETVQDYIENGVPELSREPVDYVAEGYTGCVVRLDIPTFDTWDEAAEFIGRDIPLAPENSVLRQGTAEPFRVFVSGNMVSLRANYDLDGLDVSCGANVAVQEGSLIPFWSTTFGDETSVAQQQTTTGSGADVLLYTITGDHAHCDANFILDGIFYRISLGDTADTALMEEILAAF